MKHVKKNKTSCSFSPPSYSRSKPSWTQRFLKQAWGSFGFNWCPVWLFWETVCMWMKWKPLEITSAVPCGRAGWGHLLKETIIFSVILNCIRCLCTESKSQKYTTEPRAKEALPEYLHKAMLRFYNYNRKSALDYKSHYNCCDDISPLNQTFFSPTTKQRMLAFAVSRWIYWFRE